MKARAAEESGDASNVAYFGALVEQHDRGAYADRLSPILSHLPNFWGGDGVGSVTERVCRVRLLSVLASTMPGGLESVPGGLA